MRLHHATNAPFTLRAPWIKGHHWLPKLLEVCNSGCKDETEHVFKPQATANTNSEIPSFGTVLRTSSCLHRVKSPGRSGWHRFAWTEITVMSHKFLFHKENKKRKQDTSNSNLLILQAGLDRIWARSGSPNPAVCCHASWTANLWLGTPFPTDQQSRMNSMSNLSESIRMPVLQTAQKSLDRLASRTPWLRLANQREKPFRNKFSGHLACSAKVPRYRGRNPKPIAVTN